MEISELYYILFGLGAAWAYSEMKRSAFRAPLTLVLVFLAWPAVVMYLVIQALRAYIRKNAELE